MSENVRLTRTKWGTPYGIRDNNGYLFFFHDITCFEGQEDRFIKESKEREQLCTDLVGFLSNRSTLTQQEQEIARLTEELAWSENAWKNAEAELRRNGIDGEGIVDALISGFNMVYTSPAWSGDERTPEGWKKKEKAIRKAFTATIKKAITLFMVFLEFAKERVRVAEDCLDIKKKEVELLRAEVERLTRERDEWKGKAEEAVESMKYFERLHDKMQDAIGPLLGELSALRSEMKGMVRVDVLLRWMESRSRVLNRLGGAIMSRAGSNPGEQARAQMEWLTTVLTARQARGGGR